MGIVNRSNRGEFEGSGATGLLLDLAGRPESTKTQRLQAEIRDAIRQGRLRPGDRLPSTRTLATDLGWARNVVVDAYNQLTAEGYLNSRVGQGTWVTDRAIEPPARPGEPVDDQGPKGPEVVPVRIDLQPGLPDLVGFPTRDWRRSVNHALDKLPAAELGYVNGEGAPALRHSLARYLNRARATDLQADQILVTTGVSASLRLLAEVAGGPGRAATVAVEDPGAYTQWEALDAAGSTGATIVPVPVDHDGIVTDELDRIDADLVVVTPAHQYPLGGVLSAERREALVDWARRRPGRLIVEDDYDAEFRYDRQPIGSIQGVAPDVTVVTNSVSKTLAPGLRLGWMGLPRHRVDGVADRLRRQFITPDVVQQHALADLIDSGRYDRIVRTRHRLYRRRRQALIEAISSVDGCRVPGAAGGLHLAVLLPEGVDDRAVSAGLQAVGIDVPPLSRYRINPGPPGLVASFASCHPDDAAEVATHLARLLG